MFDLQFIKSIIEVYHYYQSKNYNNSEFLLMIDKCFKIKKTTFYDWLNNDDIVNSDIIFENNNKLINNAVETFVVNLYNENNKIGIKTIKNKIKNNFKFVINNKSINYIFYKNNLKHKNIKKFDFYKDNVKIKKDNKKFLEITNEQRLFILNNKNENIKKINNLFFNEFNINIHQKQIVNIMSENKIEIKSFFKSSPAIIKFILKSVDENKIYTVKKKYLNC